MDTIDIVTVYNNPELYMQMKKSAQANRGFININFIGLCNIDGKYKSAAQAYNYAIQNLCVSDVIVFCHQDIIFLHESLTLIIDQCKKNQNTLFGVAGRLQFKSLNDIDGPIISCIQEGNYKKYDTLGFGDVVDVFTLDECLIAGSKNIFNSVTFDNQTFDGWHLYSVDLCIQCHLANLPVKVIGANIIHLSSGKLDSRFRYYEKALSLKWKKEYKILSYPCGWTYTFCIGRKIQEIVRVLRGTYIDGGT